jgi:4-amino-4-deoxy-L-arabinose transferase-like glycosyltransferase
MRSLARWVVRLVAIFLGLVGLHLPLLGLPYYWDEAGYYIPAALDFFHSGLLIPQSTLTTGHTPLVPVYLATAWHLFGYSPFVTRVAMLLLAAATVTALYALARLVANREVAIWSALLLALSPVFFAQSSLAHLDLTVGLCTTLAVLALLRRSRSAGPTFALTASLAVLSKETAVVLLPVVWAFAWFRRKERQAVAWVWLVFPLLPLLAWAVYYHHVTGYWTGNREYLDYNLYSALHPIRIFLSLLRRLYQFFIGGFNWLLVAGAMLGIWGRRKRGDVFAPQENHEQQSSRDFVFLTVGLTALYILMLSVVGGATLRRYFLPVFPLFFLAAVALIFQLPKRVARSIVCATTFCLVGSWFINPPYPFPFEDNLAYADFARLHQQTAAYLESLPGNPRILTAWPASDELARPFLGYVRRPLHVVAVSGFKPEEFREVSADSFDLLYLYSRKWEPAHNLLNRIPFLERLQTRYFDYAPQARDDWLAAQYGLRLLQQFERRGQWVRVYSKQGKPQN